MGSMDGEGIHQSWLTRSHVAAAYGVFAVYAGIFALVGRGYDQTWAICAAAGYTLGAVATWRWGVSVRTLALTAVAAVVIPLIVFDTGPFTDGMVVISRSAALVLRDGTPYLPDGKSTSWLAYDPYLPAMAVFGLPKAAGLAGAVGNPALWLALTSVAGFWAAFAIAAPHQGLGCGDCRREALRRTLFAVASPVVALNVAITTTDPPVLALMLLALAFAGQPARWRAAGIALGFACALKATAWLEIPVLATLFWARDSSRAAARFVIAALVTAAGLIAVIAPAALRDRVIAENTILFPLGLAHQPTPAQSFLPGHLLAASVPHGRVIAVALLLAAGVAVVVSLVVRPPLDVPAVCYRLAIGLSLMFVFGPAERFGYFMYPVGLLGWAWLTRSSRRVDPGVIPSQVEREEMLLSMSPCSRHV